MNGSGMTMVVIPIARPLFGDLLTMKLASTYFEMLLLPAARNHKYQLSQSRI